MTERGLRFTDTDDNRLELWLKQDRIQLVVIDGRPGLEGDELRKFASVVFAEYVGQDLATRLAQARLRLAEARSRSGDASSGRGSEDELGVAIDGALRAIDEVAAAIAPESARLLEPDRDLVPEPDSEPESASLRDPMLEAGIPLATLLRTCRPYPPLKPRAKPARKPSGPRGSGGGTGGTGGDRAGERCRLGWH